MGSTQDGRKVEFITTVRLELAARDALDLLARKRHRARAILIRDAVDLFLSQNSSDLESSESDKAA